jgi:hypothetical protein
MPRRPDPLTAEFASDQATLGLSAASTPAERRAALIACLTDFWPSSVDIDTLERIDDPSRRLHGWVMWQR